MDPYPDTGESVHDVLFCKIVICRREFNYDGSLFSLATRERLIQVDHPSIQGTCANSGLFLIEVFFLCLVKMAQYGKFNDLR